ncbi:uncharacterized protein LOC131171253 [Hevea brasiliensis]|uniref:uncharacterized protein LOC131171253 n=1 Tax=Hevea brasiliensis TaxID=3981 RepID=UPI0025D4099B|nr:uncharacterized protein LOC131171253 [Hevea brasiliensis]
MEKLQASVKKQAEFTGMGLLDADDFDIHLDGNLPEKFKMPDLAKFDGTGDPKTHLRSYLIVMKITGLTKNKVTQFFSMSLEGVASSWYHGLEATVRKDWEELVRRFVQQYSYNTALDVTLRDLETTRQKPNETFSEYLLRWRKKAMKMTNRPAEKDQVRLVVKSLQPSYYEKLCYYPLATFEQLYDAGVLVEDVLNNERKSYQPKRGGYQSAGNITGENKVIEVQTVSRTPRKFSQFNQPLSKVFERLKARGLLQPLAPRPPPNPLPPNYNANLYCQFHQTHGHDTDRCFRLKHEVQDLIDAKKIADPENRPNTRTNPMPNHNLDEPRSVMTIDIWDSSSDEEGLLDVWVDSDGEEKSRVSHMTKSGRYYPDPPMKKDDVRGKSKVLAEEDTDEEDDQFLRQLKRTQASVTIWELLLASEKHRTALTKALSVLKGRNHSRALFVTAEVGGWKVPCVMIDDGSAINVCPLKILPKLGISMSELTGSDLVIRAYDDSKRNVIGVLKIMVKVGPIETEVEFTVLDIPMTFSLLLGRIWFHPLGGVPSTLHQKIKIPHQDGVITINAERDGEVAMLQVDGSVPLLSGFQVAGIYGDWMDPRVATMMKEMKFFPGMGAGKAELMA